MKEVRWNDIKTFLVDKIYSQTLIDTWTMSMEVNLRKRVMKNVFQANLKLEGYRLESLIPLIEVHDQWQGFFDQRKNPQFEEGGSSSAPKVVELDTSK